MASITRPTSDGGGWISFAQPVSSGSGAAAPAGFCNANGIASVQFDFPTQNIVIKRAIFCFKWALLEPNQSFNDAALKMNRTLGVHPAVGNHGMIYNLTLSRYQQSNALVQNPYYTDIVKLMTEGIPAMQVAHRSEGANTHPGLLQTSVRQEVTRGGTIWNDAFIEMMDPTVTNPTGWVLTTTRGVSYRFTLPTTLGVVVAPYRAKYSVNANNQADMPNPFFGRPGGQEYMQADWATANIKIVAPYCIYQWEMIDEGFTPTISFIFSKYNFQRQPTTPSKEFVLGFSTPQMNLRRLQLVFRKQIASTQQVFGYLATNAVAIDFTQMLNNNDPTFYTYPAQNDDYRFGISATMPDNLIWPYVFGVNANSNIFRQVLNGQRLIFDYDPYGPGLTLTNTNVVAHMRLQSQANAPLQLTRTTLEYDNSLSKGPTWEVYLGTQLAAVEPPGRALYPWYSFAHLSGYLSIASSELTMVTLNTQRLTVNTVSQIITNEPQEPDPNSPPPACYLTNFAPPITTLIGANMRMIMGIPLDYSPPMTSGLRVELPNSGFLGEVSVKYQIDIPDGTSSVQDCGSHYRVRFNPWMQVPHRIKYDALLGCSGLVSQINYQFAHGKLERKNLRRCNHLLALYKNDSDLLVSTGYTTGQSYDCQLGPNGSHYEDVQPYRALNMTSPDLSTTVLVSEPPPDYRYKEFQLRNWDYQMADEMGSNSWYLLEDLTPTQIQTCTLRLRDLDEEVALRLINKPLMNTQRWYIDFYFDNSGNALAFVPASSAAQYWGPARLLDATVFSLMDQKTISAGTTRTLNTFISPSFLNTIYSPTRVVQRVKSVLAGNTVRFQPKFFVQTLLHTQTVTDTMLREYVANGFDLTCLDVIPYTVFIRDHTNVHYAGGTDGLDGSRETLTDTIPLPVSNMVPIVMLFICTPEVLEASYACAWDAARGPIGYNLGFKERNGLNNEFVNQVTDAWQQEYRAGLVIGSAQLPHAIGRQSPMTQTYPIGFATSEMWKAAGDTHMVLKPLFDNQMGFTQAICNSAWNYMAWGMTWGTTRKFLDSDLQFGCSYKLISRSQDNLFHSLSKIHYKLPPLFMHVIPWSIDRAPFMNCQFVKMGYTFPADLNQIAYPASLTCIGDYVQINLAPPLVEQLPPTWNPDANVAGPKALLRNYMLPTTVMNLYDETLRTTPANLVGKFAAFMPYLRILDTNCTRLVVVRKSIQVGPGATTSQFGNGARLQTIGTSTVTTQ